jgi:hypothetical protein
MVELNGTSNLRALRNVFIDRLQALPQETVVRRTMNGDNYTASQVAQYILEGDGEGADWMRLHLSMASDRSSMLAEVKAEGDFELLPEDATPPEWETMPPELLVGEYWALYQALLERTILDEADVVAWLEDRPVQGSELRKALQTRAALAHAWLLDVYHRLAFLIASYGNTEDDVDEDQSWKYGSCDVDDDPVEG